MEREVWLPIPDYEGLYEVSNLGRVRRDPTAPARSLGVPGNLLQPSRKDGSYPFVSLSNNGRVRSHRVHRLVMRAFCGEPPFPDAHVCHNDGDVENCRLRNLRWDTAYGNQADVERHGRRCRGEAVFGAKLTEKDVRSIRQRILAGQRNPEIADDFDVSISTIHLIRHNKTWSHV